MVVPNEPSKFMVTRLDDEEEDDDDDDDEEYSPPRIRLLEEVC